MNLVPRKFKPNLIPQGEESVHKQLGRTSGQGPFRMDTAGARNKRVKLTVLNTELLPVGKTARAQINKMSARALVTLHPIFELLY